MVSYDPEIVAEFIASLGMPICECREESLLRTSWTEMNPGRQFNGCPNYRTLRGRCKFFLWVDPDFPKCAKNVINALLRKTERLDKENREMVKRQRIMKVRKVFIWSVALIFIGIPMVSSWMELNKE